MFIPGKPTIEFMYIKELVGYKRLDLLNFKNIFFFSKAREALLAGLKVLSSRAHGRIWLPAYICKSVLEPVYKLGYKPGFYEIKENLEPDLEIISISDGDIFLFVHYFGLTQNPVKLKRYFRDKEIFIIEDGAHTLPYVFCGTHGRFGEFAIFSLRKTVAVPDGGILIVNHPQLLEKMGLEKFHLLPWNTQGKKILFLLLEKLAFQTGINLLKVKKDLKNIFKQENNLSIKRISKTTPSILSNMDFDRIVQTRKRNFFKLIGLISPFDEIYLPFRKLTPDSIPQVLPRWNDKANELVNFLWKKGIEAYQWPAKELPENIDLKKFPVTKKWVNKAVLLPVHQGLKKRHIEYIADSIREGLKRI